LKILAVLLAVSRRVRKRRGFLWA